MANKISPENRALLGAHPDHFVDRHLGPRQSDLAAMLAVVGADSVDALIDETVPSTIRIGRPLNIPAAISETDLLARMNEIAAQNEQYRSFIGMGYYGTITPPVILRNVLENPGYYTQYTPYQPEISQGRLEALLNFQTMIMDMTGLEIANSSLLDEATAAAEAMTLAHRALGRRSKGQTFFISEKCHPQTIAVVQTRAEPLGIKVVVGDHEMYEFSAENNADATFGILLQYPDTDGSVLNYGDFIAKTHAAGGLAVVTTDLLALTLLTPPGEFGADIVVGNSQRFGVPMGYGGPHAGFMATKEAYKRMMPGRLIGVSIDSNGKPAYRLALQTREQHIRRERATSNICTAQVLLAIMASMYAVYHGPTGLKRIAKRVALLTDLLRRSLLAAGYSLNGDPVFDTLKVSGGALSQAEIVGRAEQHHFNLRSFADGTIGVSLDETASIDDVRELVNVFGGKPTLVDAVLDETDIALPDWAARTSDYLTHPIFNSHHSETEMLRYLTRLQSRDLSLTSAMIPLGSCTMKLNATAQMMPISNPGFATLHPFVPQSQAQGYQRLFNELGDWLAEITGFAAISFQPNAGSQGEYSGLMTIRSYHLGNGDNDRNICLIPSSAHGTNPASAVMAGMKVVVVKCDHDGNVDVDDLRAKAQKHESHLAAFMITYPSTHGVFEASIREMCDIVHEHGGLVYLDGANMNAQVGLSRPGDYGADVCHLNLHKTFAIPHGGGGPGVGPIGVVPLLLPYLPGHPVVSAVGGEKTFGPVSAAPWGSASILPISYAYIAMLGANGLRRSSEIAILNANYIAMRLDEHYPVLYKGANGRVAHECIIDLRPLTASSGIKVDDVAKRLMDFGFHAPTMSFPVPGTLMIEPTESESKEELDRFCDTLIIIRKEIAQVEAGEYAADDNPLVGAPHSAEMIADDSWSRAYGRELAAYPAAWIRGNKFWPAVGRIDNVYGDRNLVCACLPISDYE